MSSQLTLQIQIYQEDQYFYDFTLRMWYQNLFFKFISFHLTLILNN
jgi:hypothetical protein